MSGGSRLKLNTWLGGDSEGDLQRRRTVMVLVVTAATLAVGLALQLVPAGDGRMFGDIAALHGLRGIDLAQLPYVDQRLEYPVVVGILMWLTSIVAGTATAFFIANAAVLASLALLAAHLLHRRDGDRVWRYALAPTLALYAFHNWDVLPVVATVAGLIALEQRRPAASGALLAIGAWTKLYPALIAGALAIVMWHEDRAAAKRLLVGATLVTALVNLPFMLASFEGWWHPFEFHAARGATWGTVWSHLLRLPGADALFSDAPATLNVLSVTTLGVGFAIVMWYGSRRPVEPAALAAALTAVFLLTSKVYSPQYSLWLLPFFVMLPLSAWLWWAFIAADVAMYLLVFGHFYAGGFDDVTTLIGIVVLSRAALLVAVIRESLNPSTERTPPIPVGTARVALADDAPSRAGFSR